MPDHLHLKINKANYLSSAQVFLSKYPENPLIEVESRGFILERTNCRVDCGRGRISVFVLVYFFHFDFIMLPIIYNH